MGQSYSQRLSGVGWAGVASIIATTIAMPWIFGLYFSRPPSLAPSPMWASLTSTLHLLGWVAVAVGREFHPIAPGRSDREEGDNSIRSIKPMSPYQ